MSRGLARFLVRLAAILLPPSLRDWGRAMAAELGTIEGARPALSFASGCLGCAIRKTIAHHSLKRPRRLAAVCAVCAIGLGLAYLSAAGAPMRYLAMNSAAAALGLLALGVMTETARLTRLSNIFQEAIALALGFALLAVSLFGESADGVTRWISVGGVLLQPSLFIVPVLAVRFAWSRDGLSTLAVLVAVLALALQPDRAMAGALALGLAASALVRPGRNAFLATGGALAGLAATFARPDTSPVAPFVDQVFYSSFDVHPLAGLAVLAGAMLMIAPAIVGWVHDAGNRHAYAVFGAVWLAVMAAAALGNYPTPLIGYGGSAIIGYLISLVGLPPRAGAGAAGRGEEGTRPDQVEPPHHLRAGISTSTRLRPVSPSYISPA